MASEWTWDILQVGYYGFGVKRSMVRSIITVSNLMRTPVSDSICMANCSSFSSLRRCLVVCSGSVADTSFGQPPSLWLIPWLSVSTKGVFTCSTTSKSSSSTAAAAAAAAATGGYAELCDPFLPSKKLSLQWIITTVSNRCLTAIIGLAQQFTIQSSP